MTTPISRQPFIDARRDIKDLVLGPCRRWWAFAPEQRSADDFRNLYEIPMRLADAGFLVNVSYYGGDCMIEIEKDLMKGVTLDLVGEGSTYLEALSDFAYLAAFQVAEVEDATLGALDAGASGVTGGS